ncbi:MAG: hypothetical protein ABI266_08695 [Ginsengibacter sp.]
MRGDKISITRMPTWSFRNTILTWPNCYQIYVKNSLLLYRFAAFISHGLLLNN